jgi:hypothetical protein
MHWLRSAPFLSFIFSLCLLTGQPAQAQGGAQQFDPELRDLLQQAINSPNSFGDKFDAAVWLHDMSKRLEGFIEDPKERVELLKSVHYEASRANLEPELVLAVIEVESHFDRFAISVSGARGLMQVMPFWLDEIQLSDKNLFKIRTNLRMGSTILRFYLDKEKGNLVRALARYNGSLGKFKYPKKVIAALNRHWFKQ